jgi:beta-aspartyl-peptidase (threonine type)
MNSFSLAIHGGAGTILPSAMSPEKEQAYKTALRDAIQAGIDILSSNGSALEAVEACVRNMEDNYLFNAGKGSVFTADGKNEMDASIMDGLTGKAGAVACVRNIRNPITLAKMVMLKSEHVLLCSRGAEEFAKEVGVETAPDEYFFDEYRYEQLKLAQRNKEHFLDHIHHKEQEQDEEKKFGTVGAVALDVHGNLAAATSTGGMTNKMYGRIGDSPIIGAGTYAHNHTCAVSCTGHGEFFMRNLVAYDISCLMEYRGMSLREACNHVVHEKLVLKGGVGGVIAVDKYGNSELSFNSEGMYRAWVNPNRQIEVGFYKESFPVS